MDEEKFENLAKIKFEKFRMQKVISVTNSVEELTESINEHSYSIRMKLQEINKELAALHKYEPDIVGDFDD